MLGMLRRSRERREARERNCPCKGTCNCHKPEPDIHQGWAWFMIVTPIVAIVLIALFGKRPPSEVRTIHVGSKVCTVVFVKTGETCEHHLLHEECHDEGYDQARCSGR
jgi:hypothetical protein